MDTNEYLQKILESQTLSTDSGELKDLQKHRADIEEVLRKKFSESSPTIRYGGSKAKGTMIRESYDLDIICYFPHDDKAAGETLKDVYNNVYKSLSERYLVEPKSSALRIKDRDPKNYNVDFHIDVVPGRYTDDSRKDAYLYQASGEKERLKTNLDIHIKHIKESGFTDAIRLFKLWKVRNGLRVKTFALELLTIESLKGSRLSNLSLQLEYVWERLRDDIKEISIEDPANPQGNDLSDLLSPAIQLELSSVATKTLEAIQNSGWEAVFGPVEGESKDKKSDALRRAVVSVTTPTKPWFDDL